MPTDDVPGSSLRPRLFLVAACATIALLAWAWVGYARYALAAIAYPFGLDYSEGLIWQQACWLFGPHAYGDITHLPFVVFEYPPLYPLAVRLAGGCGAATLAAGRGISVLSMITLCVLLGLIVARIASLAVSRRDALGAGVLAGLLPTMLLPFISWSVLMRVDLLALALTYLGLALAIWSLSRPSLLAPAVLAFVAAVFTKQIYMAAPVSVGLVMLIRAPRVAMRAYRIAAALGIALVLALAWRTHGGFVRHVFLYTVDRVNLPAAWRLTSEWLLAYPVLAALVPVAVVAAWRHAGTSRPWPGARAFVERIRADAWTASLAILTIYLALTTLMLVAAGKIGSSRNYFLEWMALWCVWIGLLAAMAAQARARQAASTRRGWAMAALALPFLLAIQCLPIPAAIDTLRAQQFSPVRRAQAAALRARLAQLPGLVLSDDMVALMQSGHEVAIEQGILHELAVAGLWNERTLVDLLRAHRFAALVTAYDPGDPTFDARYLPGTRAAMLADYPVVERYGDYRLRLPK